MLEYLFFITLVLLAVVGLSEVIHFLAVLLFKPKTRAKKCVLVYLDRDYAESQIISELFNLHWYGDKMADKLVFITSELSPEEVRKLKREYQSGLIEFKNGAFNERAE